MYTYGSLCHLPKSRPQGVRIYYLSTNYKQASVLRFKDFYFLDVTKKLKMASSGDDSVFKKPFDVLQSATTVPQPVDKQQNNAENKTPKTSISGGEPSSSKDNMKEEQEVERRKLQ